MTELVIILDRSGSMGNIAKSASEAVNNYINEQKNGPDKCNITVWEFDNIINQLVPRTPIEDCPVVAIKARNSTKLYDAIGEAIVETNTVINKARRKRPTVLFVIQTDGLENSSIKYDKSKIKELILENQAKGDQFIFLGANFMDQQAQDIGISVTNSVGFDQSAQAYHNSFSLTSRETKNLRAANVAGQSYSISMK